MSRTEGMNKDRLGPAALLALGLAGGWALRAWPQANAAPLLASAGVLLLGLRRGALAAWLAGIACGAASLGLFLAGAIGPVLLGATLAALFVATLFPIPWNEAQERARLEFEVKRLPLAEQRDLLVEQLAALELESQVSERRSRETDALYHAGREISKLLTLEDTLSFSKEVLRDTLRLSDPRGEGVAFALILSDEEAGTRLGCCDGLNPDEVQVLEKGLVHSLKPWLEDRGGEASVPKVAAEGSLKGVPLPPAVRGLVSLPLLIQDEAICYLMVFNMAEPKMEAQDLANLRILASQVAIGLEKASLYDKVQRLSVTDGLTGLFVHRYFQTRLDEELRRAERYKENLGLLMIDIDHFKQYNDTYGHLAGDAVLRGVSACLRGQVGAADILSRYGGEEFAVILPKQDKAQALARAEAICKAVAGMSMEFEGKATRVTVSLGVACFPQDAQKKTGLIDKADQALYAAKKGGRNRVVEAQA